MRCSKCDQELTDPARPCPRCGHRQALVPEWILWFDIVVLILSIVGFFVTDGSPLMVGFGAFAFLYMLIDLGRRNAQRPVVRSEEPADEAPNEGEETEAEPEVEEEFLPEEEEKRTCASCGTVLEEGAKFCGSCGKRQAS